MERPPHFVSRFVRRWVGRLVALAFCAVLSSLGPSRADEVILRSGERIDGKIVRDSPLAVIIDSRTQGRLTISRESVERVERDNAPGPVQADPEPQVDSLFETSLSIPDERETPILIPLAPPPSLPSGTNLVRRMYWDGQLRYQFTSRLTLPDPFHSGSTFVNDRWRLKGRIGAKLAVDGGAFISTGGQQEVPADVQVRNFQVLTEGEFGLWLTNQFNVELGLIDGSFYLSKAYWRLVQIPHFGNLTVGYFTVPQTIDNIEGFGSLTFMEPSAGTAAFSPGKRVGVEWTQTFSDQRITAAAGIFSVGQDPSIDFGNASEALAQPTIRFTGLPWDARDRWLHLGLSYGFVFSGEADIQYEARPESRLAPFLVNTGQIDARQATLGGAEAIASFGPVLLQAELVNSLVLRDGDNASFLGGYFAGGWMITGESRPYNRAKGVPSRVQPRHPLWGPDAGWGAFEAAGRYSVVDLSNGGIDGGRMKIVMGGVNWYWNRYIRWQFNSGIARVTGGPSPGNLFIFEARFEGQF